MKQFVRPFAIGLLFLAGLSVDARRCVGADLWGGSLGVSSDYIVRGISRTDNQAAAQLEIHYLNTSGFLAGLFESNTRLDPGETRDVEINAFVGFAWTATDDFHGKLLASHYAYPWNSAGSHYDYDELDLDVAYRDWLNVTVAFSPNAPRFSRYATLSAGSAESVDVSMQRAVLGRLSATAGVGYYSMHGTDASGYGYWSAGAAYELAPVSFVVSYVNTTAGAKALFYNGGEGNRWTGTVIWRF